MIAIWMPSGMELLIILVIVVMFFGLGKLPQVAKELGTGIRSFQKSLKGEDEEDEAAPEPKALGAEKPVDEIATADKKEEVV